MSEFYIDDTIAALATPVGEGSIAVIRVSGKDSWKITDSIFKSPKFESVQSLQTHTMHYGKVLDSEDVADNVLLSLFRAPHSYTGEDIVEFSIHGGLANSQRILNLLFENGARHAEPGEFTKRAFLNGKIDLTQAEAVIDVIRAKSRGALDVAVRQLSGQLSSKIKAFKEDLMHLYAHIEAYIDFPEEDLDIYTDTQITKKLDRLIEGIQALIGSFKRTSLIREGVLVLIAGRPNAGKSSLFNALLERDRALVSPSPGTTRDHLEEPLEIKGVMIRLVDTAGLALEAKDNLDELGMKRTHALLESAHLVLFLVDGSAELEDTDRYIFSLLKNKPFLTLISKSDLPQRIHDSNVKALTGAGDFLKISAAMNHGLRELEEKMFKMIFQGLPKASEEQITRLRHKNALEKSAAFLTSAKKALENKESLEFVALELKAAIDSLRELIGEVYSEDLLDVIFAEFCIGK